MSAKGLTKVSIAFAVLLLAGSATVARAVENGAPAANAVEQAVEAATSATAMPVATEAISEAPAETVTLAIVGASSLTNGGTITVKGQAPAGKPVFLEIWADSHQVRASRFDSAVDEKTGKRPYIFYLTEKMPAFFKIVVPSSLQDRIAAEKKKGNKWSMSALLKDLGADAAFNAPAAAPVQAYQSSFLASIIGSRGSLIYDKPEKKRAMQLTKARFRGLGRVFAANLDLQEDGSFTAEIPMEKGVAPGSYQIVAHVDNVTRSAPVTFTNTINFPTVYLPNAGTSMNLAWPFLLSLAVTVFGVLMGAGGGFILNPLLLTLFPTLTHTIVAGTVTPTVLFSQGSGIYNYSKIRFISWKLGIGIGLAMLAGGFIGPKLTEMITLDQFKSAFGWILLVLAGLMFWQTTPGYLARNKKEKAIMEEFRKRAVAASKK